ncbi:MAG: hypothetical protein ACXVA0_24565, partial [Mucilaginibacter sp.]
MHSSIRFKLFLTFLATTLTVVLGMGSFMLWSFSQGFSEFTKTRHQERLKSLIESLTEDYSHDEGWTQLANDKQKWIKLL